MAESTARHNLPMIAPGQAQKEVSHNEALAALDLLVQPAVEAVGIDTPPADPDEGQCWIVGAVPTGAWAERAHALAGWTAGGWRFQTAREGMAAWTGDDGVARFATGTWTVGAIAGATLTLSGEQVVGSQQAAIADPAGGATIDTEARTALTALLTALRAHGLIAS